jgi:hypothetical protein
MDIKAPAIKGIKIKATKDSSRIKATKDSNITKGTMATRPAVTRATNSPAAPKAAVINVVAIKVMAVITAVATRVVVADKATLDQATRVCATHPSTVGHTAAQVTRAPTAKPNLLVTSTVQLLKIRWAEVLRTDNPDMLSPSKDIKKLTYKKKLLIILDSLQAHPPPPF